MKKSTFFQEDPTPEEFYDDLYDDILSLRRLYGQARAPAVEKILAQLANLDLKQYQQKNRIFLIETAIKIGDVSIVRALAEKFIQQGFSTDISLPSENNPEHAYRPVFWLAAIVTRQSNVPASNYQEIEDYLCKRFKISSYVYIKSMNKLLTRDQYIERVNQWKAEKNKMLGVQRYK